MPPPPYIGFRVHVYLPLVASTSVGCDGRTFVPRWRKNTVRADHHCKADDERNSSDHNSPQEENMIEQIQRHNEVEDSPHHYSGFGEMLLSRPGLP
jgi:hypothetical protein